MSGEPAAADDEFEPPIDDPSSRSDGEHGAGPDEPPPTIDLLGLGTATVLAEGERGVVELDLEPSAGLRVRRPPAAPTFGDATLTGLGPGRAAPGASLVVGGHRLDRHRGAAVVWGTLRGAGHADFGEPCQDACGAAVAGSDTVVIIAADGVSAGSSSGDIATAAVQYGLATLGDMAAAVDDLETLDLDQWVGDLNDALAAEVRHYESFREESAENGTTLAVAVLSLSTRFAKVGLVGDASAWIVRASGDLAPARASSKDADGVVSGRTDALPSAEPTIHTSWLDLDDALALMVCTDGVGDELVTGRSRYARWLAQFLEAPVDPVSFAYALGMRSRGATDDRGAALCWLPTR